MFVGCMTKCRDLKKIMFILGAEQSYPLVCVCVCVTEQEKTDPVPLVTRGRAIGSCLEINRKYLTVYEKLFEALNWHYV